MMIRHIRLVAPDMLAAHHTAQEAQARHDAERDAAYKHAVCAGMTGCLAPGQFEAVLTLLSGMVG